MAGIYAPLKLLEIWGCCIISLQAESLGLFNVKRKWESLKRALDNKGKDAKQWRKLEVMAVA